MSDKAFNWDLKTIAKSVAGELVGENITVSGASTDTRTLAAGEIFIALTGPSFDGHDYVSVAEQRNAAAVLVSKRTDTSLPQVMVDDTRLALGRLAKAWRKQFAIPVVGITGSNGKTTVKEMVTSILACEKNVLATKGNLNNDIGMPLTLLQLSPKHTAAVIEMGANHPKEIEYLAGISCPTVAVITNAGPAHLEGFGDLDGVARSKGEIYASLDNNGVAIVNADDKYYTYWQSVCSGKKQFSFGFAAKADFRIETKAQPVVLQTPTGPIALNFKLPGKHNLMNALAAAAACQAVGVSNESIKAGLEKMQPVSGRLQLKTGCNGSRVIDDTYNANPASLNAALQVLMEYPGIHLLALGDMGELGSDAEKLHRDAGEQARQSGVNRLYAIGQYARLAAQSFGTNGMVFNDRNSLISELKNELTEDSTLLVKGSRLMRMDEIVNAVIQTGEN